MDEESEFVIVAMTNIRVSVVIPTKNAGPIFRRVLDALMHQNVPWAYEVVAVDSGSTDGTIDVIKSFPSVRLIQIKPTEFGHGKTRNFAIGKTSGQYIAMITQDALPVDGLWLKNFVDVIEVDERIAGVFGRHVAYPDASPFTRIELKKHFMGFVTKPIVFLDDRNRYITDEGYRQFLYFFSDNNALIRRSVWERIPYPNIDFAEDQAWAKLIIEAGYLKAYSHDAVVFHSHDYGLFERLQRSFDEAYALKRIFSYENEFGFPKIFKNFLGITLRDVNLIFTQHLYKDGLKHIVKMPFDNLMRVIGAYLGSRGDRIPEYLRLKLSRDKRLMRIVGDIR